MLGKTTKHFLDVKKKLKKVSLVEKRKTIFTVIEVSDTNTHKGLECDRIKYRSV